MSETRMRARGRGLVAAGSAESAAAGCEALQRGGNAADAAVAAALGTASGDPSITSLAGGGLLIFREARSGRCEVCDFFVNAPGLKGRRARGAGSTGPPLDLRTVELDFGTGGTRQRFHIGRGTAAVPGALSGLQAALERWGRLSFEEVSRPAVRFLREGIRVTEYQASCFRVLEPILAQSSEGRELFFPRGRLLRPGDTFRNPVLADLLERCAALGAERVEREVVYPRILEEFGEEKGGWITGEDLDAWRPRFVAPLQGMYRGTEIATSPPPAQGGTFVLLTLGLFERCEAGLVPAEDPHRWFLYTAAFRAIAEARAEDPRIWRRNDAAEFLAERLERLLRGEDPHGAPEPREPSRTTHISAADREGNACGVTLSHGEGCGVWIPGTGLHMNNMLGEEDLFPGGLLRFEPGERLSTMMAPSILVSPQGAVTVLGSGGSNRIRTALAQVVSALADDGLDPEEAVTRGRLHFENGVLSAETYALPGGEAAISEARRLAREVKCFDRPSLFFGGVHAVLRRADGTVAGAGDPRRGGVVLWE